VADSPLRILQVNRLDSNGGAAKVAWDLFQAYHQKGHLSWLVAGFKRSNDPFVVELNHGLYRKGLSGWLEKLWKPFRKFELVKPGLHLLHQRMLLVMDHQKMINRLMGIEDFEYPGTAHLLDLIPERVDVLQFHNLHGGYFDLRELANLSQQVSVVLTLHDAWLLSGHCSHSFDCERWKIGCGHCPDLFIPPSIRRDATAFNWQRKREIFSKSRLYIASPSRWLMQKVEKSMLAPAAVEMRIIPNGVDLTLFRPADKGFARESIGIQQDLKMIFFASDTIRQNIFKDYKTMQSAIALIAEHLQGQRIIFVALGEKTPPEYIGQTEIRFMPYQKDSKLVARYYQASDIYIHAARADTFPNTILESLACGKPVVATEVGGIPEQIADGETGFLVPPGDAQGMATRIEQILSNDDLRQKMGQAAVDSARHHFDLQRQVDDYLEWYKSLLTR
jgi:glycosyltransferase involved in cell wall biosynthesis